MSARGQYPRQAAVDLHHETVDADDLSSGGAGALGGGA